MLQTSSPQLQIAYLPISALAPDPGNPRRHEKKQLKQIARSIETFGFNVPVLIDGARKIIAGHGRVMACQHLGMTEVPTIQLEHLSDAQARAFMIADNRLTEISCWDDRLLAEQFNVLSGMNLDFSLEATGFDMGEIDLRIQSLGEDEDSVEPDLTELPVGPAVSQSGDLWLMGPHRVLCGSALEPGSYATLMQGKRAAAIFSDPPYNVPIDGHVCGLGETRHREFAMAAGEMTAAEFTEFLTKVCTLFAANSENGSLHFLCMDWRHMSEMLGAGNAAYGQLKNLCVWAKDMAGMGSLYRSQHELVFVFKHDKASHRNNIQLGRFGRSRSNVWNYPSVSAFGRAGEEGRLLDLHPTVKPLSLVADAILDCTQRGNIVLDGFLGSGTTVIAGERTGRACYGLELDPLYVDTIVRRWQAWTGQDAIHAITGRTFLAMTEERHG